MKLKKILAGASATVMAVGALAVSASANALWTIPEGTEHDDGLSLEGGMYLVQLFNVGNEAENKPAKDYGIKPHDVAKISFWSEALPVEGKNLTLDDFIMGEDGAFGGGVVFSANGGDFGTSSTDSPIYDEETGLNYWNKYNWPNKFDWWGVPAENDTPEGMQVSNEGPVDYNQANVWEYLSPFHYKLECTIPDELRWPEDKKAGCYQIGMQEWNQSYPGYFCLKINYMVVYDESDKPLIAFDSLGYPEQDEAKIKAKIAELETAQPATPAESGTSSGTTDPADTQANTESTGTSNSNAPANTAANTTSSGSSSSGSSSISTPVGLIIGIIVAVVAVIVVVVIVVVKKKKQ